MVANHLRHAAARRSVSGEQFMAIYLLSHGVIKMFAVAAQKQTLGLSAPDCGVWGIHCLSNLSFRLTGGIGLVALTVFDLVAICLIWLEYCVRKVGPQMTP